MSMSTKDREGNMTSMQSGSDACSGEEQILCRESLLIASITRVRTSKHSFTSKNGVGSVRTDPAQIHPAGIFPKLDPFR